MRNVWASHNNQTYGICQAYAKRKMLVRYKYNSLHHLGRYCGSPPSNKELPVYNNLILITERFSEML